MAAVLFAVVLQGALGAASAGSLGIGIDVLPEAFSFAASRAGYAPRLRLAGCDARVCRWHLGDGVDMTASLSPRALDIERIEAEIVGAATAATPAAYGKACLAIVALLDPAASDARRRSIAAAIATADAGRQVALGVSGADASLYGAADRCGAAASRVDVGSRL